jgi:CRISPR-associated exonuclease Cas4
MIAGTKHIETADDSPMKANAPITATALTYLKICRRKLWLHAHGIRIENENVNVQIGKHIQQTTFDRHEKDIPLGEIGVIDWAEFKNGVLHETKKGKVPSSADELQVKYYMSWMRRNGIEVNMTMIHYPQQRRTKEIGWHENMHEEVDAAVVEAQGIVEQDVPPPVIRLPYCKTCAFHDFCFS